MASPMENYAELRSAFVEADRRIDKIANALQNASAALRRDKAKGPFITGVAAGTVHTNVTGIAFILAADFPTADQITAAVTHWRDAQGALLQMWASLDPAMKESLASPPHSAQPRSH